MYFPFFLQTASCKLWGGLPSLYGVTTSLLTCLLLVWDDFFRYPRFERSGGSPGKHPCTFLFFTDRILQIMRRVARLLRSYHKSFNLPASGVRWFLFGIPGLRGQVVTPFCSGKHPCTFHFFTNSILRIMRRVARLLRSYHKSFHLPASGVRWFFFGIPGLRGQVVTPFWSWKHPCTFHFFSPTASCKLWGGLPKLIRSYHKSFNLPASGVSWFLFGIPGLRGQVVIPGNPTYFPFFLPPASCKLWGGLPKLITSYHKSFNLPASGVRWFW